MSTLNRAIMAFMKRASITEARNRLSALIEGLKRGSTVLIVDRGRPVARLEPVASGPSGQASEGRLERLVRDGLVRPGLGRLSESISMSRPPALARGASAVLALLDERRQGR